MPSIKPIGPIAAASLLTLLVAGCGGDQGGSPSSQPQSSAPQSSAPQSSAPQSSPQASPQASQAASPAAGNDAGADAATPAGTAQDQQDNYYGQPAPAVTSDEDPQAQWKDQREASDDAAPAN